jgi:hypothetical protein
MLKVDTERRFSLDSARDGELVEPLPRFKNRGLAPSNVSTEFLGVVNQADDGQNIIDPANSKKRKIFFQKKPLIIFIKSFSDLLTIENEAGRKARLKSLLVNN